MGTVARSQAGAGRAAVAGATLALTAIAAAQGASAETGHPVRVALARGVIVAAPLAVGLYALRRPASARFGAVLVVAGAVLFISTLAESGADLPYTIGRIGGWWIEVVLAYLILAFPSGRLREPIDRRLVQALALVALVLFMPRLFLTDTFELPSPYTSCTEGCPSSALQIVDASGFVDGVLRPLGAAATFAGLLAVLVRITLQMHAATPVSRRLLLPMAAFGGEVEVRSAPGVGTAVKGRVPAARQDPG